MTITNGFFFLVKLLSFCQFPSFKLLILYRKNNCSVNEFLQALTYIIQSKQSDIILGDFNGNCLQKNNICPRFQSEGLRQIVTGSTHVRGSLLDYIYVQLLWEFSNIFSKS